MKFFGLFILLITLLSGCIKEQSSQSDTYFVNATSHLIRVNSYGALNKSFEITPGQTKNVLSQNAKVLNNGISYGYISQPVDSFIVVFDMHDSIVHYKSYLVGNNPKRYLYSSRRNIYNDSSYIKTLVSESKNFRGWSFTYTFTEQDYLDAQ